MAEPCNAYIIGEGQAFITPGKTKTTRTLTVKLDSGYHKIREVEIRAAPGAIQQIQKQFKPDQWLLLGRGKHRIAINKASLHKAHAAALTKSALRGNLADRPRLESAKEKVDALLFKTNPSVTPLATPTALLERIQKTTNSFAGITPSFQSTATPPTQKVKMKDVFEHLEKKGYKITVIQNLNQQLEVVALRELGTGSYKIARIARTLWQPIAEAAEPASGVNVLAKTRPNASPEEMIKEANISRDLELAGIPYTLQFQKISRQPLAGEARYGLISELCREGSLDSFIQTHFDSAGKLKPEFQEQHTTLAYQIAQSLEGMHKNGVIHGDVKTENTLVQKGPEARVIDYGFMGIINQEARHSQGTFPPPDQVKELEDTGKTKNTPQSDAWAFGMLLHELTHQIVTFDDFGHSCSSDHMMQSLPGLYATLDPNNPTDQVIRGLLEANPSQRMTMTEAREKLGAILGPTHPEVQKCTKRLAPPEKWTLGQRETQKQKSKKGFLPSQPSARMRLHQARARQEAQQRLRTGKW